MLPPAHFPPLVLAAAAARRVREAGAHDLWEWIEANGAIVYPALALAIIGLIVAALLATWRSEEMSAEQRGRLKLEILQIVRRRISGVSAEAVAAELQVDLMLAARLLGELDEEGLVSSSRTGAQTPAMYRLRGR